ncbi:hypothetical protein E2C01_064398 [Portunus trituberculatus]|uniref:Uncharacterized protein n=1 Tax=Portunus trituberculatus TaxID=210409 RepID=A0A5B7HN43_PORTR|nr:hypothetical protein [Portunus trituberculatus]
MNLATFRPRGATQHPQESTGGRGKTGSGYLLSGDSCRLDALDVDAQFASLLRPEAHHAEAQTAALRLEQLQHTTTQRQSSHPVTRTSKRRALQRKQK